jgi:hypothetical protein
MPMKPRIDRAELFIPCTREIEIGDGVVYRPIRSWMSLTYAGEGLQIVRGDASGCVDARGKCSKPNAVVHRLYWRRLGWPDEPQVSAFLSYPHGMGACSEYFWEAYAGDEPERYFGTDAESEMETMLRESLRKR